VVACTDLLLYFHRHRPGCRCRLFWDDSGEGLVSAEQYNDWVRRVQIKYLPVIPHMGTIGLELAFALNRCLKDNGIPMGARFGVGRERLWRSMEAMLGNDIPVILAVGANFPLPLKRHKLSFYRSGQTAPACGTSAHFVSVTGMDDSQLRISSWGKEYYIRRQEFWDYARNHSAFSLSNILWVWPNALF